MNEQTESKETFETAYKRLDGIVNRMEKENLDLGEALKAFEDGQKTIMLCRKMLEEAELKLKDLRQAEQD